MIFFSTKEPTSYLQIGYGMLSYALQRHKYGSEVKLYQRN